MENNNDNKTVCEFCDKTFSSIYSLKKHIETAKICIKKRNVPLELSPVYNCQYCKKDFYRKDNLAIHHKTCSKKEEHEDKIIQKENKEIQNRLEKIESDLREKTKELEKCKKVLDEAQIKIRILEEKNRELNDAYKSLKETNTSLNIDLGINKGLLEGLKKSKKRKQVINITNYGNNCVLSPKLVNINIDNIVPLTIERVRLNLHRYDYIAFLKGMAGLIECIKAMVVDDVEKLNLCGPIEAKANYACTDPSRHKYFRLNHLKSWESDLNAKYIHVILDEMMDTIKIYWHIFSTSDFEALVEQYGYEDGTSRWGLMRKLIGEVYYGIVDPNERDFLHKTVRSKLDECLFF